ncbi:MAG: two-component sensor histidine kinase [Deltaproteobacteria bacterium]|nr:two-component sensor histidine kinase [Deltaproteobacteria bacterium]MBW1962260.1 two-component sensor histidine kinase [Deltaproteobacteria bacterium]MBW1994247.1 two-component sensor histidine kinase [Deltaproteobacteria bacterium]MBW2150976.1 two-component sensor histidine kinase [Deltaproteobacteria bacterium]
MKAAQVPKALEDAKNRLPAPAINSKDAEEKVKPFRLVKYFSFTSIVVIFLGIMALSLLNTNYARTLQHKKSEEYAKVLVENLNHQIFIQFVLPVLLRYGKIQLREEDQYRRMDQVVRNTLYSLKVDSLKVYDLNNVIIYSLDKEMTGKKGLGGEEYKAALSGKYTSILDREGHFLEIFFGLPKQVKLITFAPFRAEFQVSRITGPVLGVFEIVQDLSDDYKTIFWFQIRVIITSTLVMSVLFVVLLFLVKRGEAFFEKRAEERLRLKEQLSRAERLSSLGEMAAKISHEIRNPLGIIKSSAALLKKKMQQLDPSNTVPDVIVEETNRLNNIITDFFNYAKPRTLNLTPCHVQEVLQKNLTFLAPQIEEQGYRIETRYGENIPEIMADSSLLYQAFLNILMNSMQAMPEGGDIQIEAIAANGAIHITFEDSGEGIAEEILEKIWEPFYTTKEKGTGLGLGIVKNIIESHGGNIQVENRKTGGARVIIALPIQQGT